MGKRRAMFQSPDLNDYRDWVRYHLDEYADGAVLDVKALRQRAAANGRLISGATITETIDAAYRKFNEGLIFAFGALRWAVKHTLLDEDEMRSATLQLLENFKIQMKAICEIPEIESMPNRGVVDAKLLKLDERLQFLTRQFDVGLFVPQEQEMAKADNSITVHSMSGGAIQQNSPSATQIVNTSVNVDGVKAALAAFEIAIAEVRLDRDAAASLKGDIDTIRAQLAKPNPSTTMLQEAGRSARSVVEGIAGGLLTQPVLAAAPALWSALGLG